jgi:hypothetical protein
MRRFRYAAPPWSIALPLLLLPVHQLALTVIVFILIMIAALGPAIYSLVLYKRLERRGEV